MKENLAAEVLQVLVGLLQDLHEARVLLSADKFHVQLNVLLLQSRDSLTLELVVLVDHFFLPLS